MRNNFTKLFFATAMMLCSLAMPNVQAAATINELVAIDKDWTFVADEITSNGTVGITTANTFFCDGRIFSPTTHSVSSGKGNSTFSDGEVHLNSLRLKNAQDRLAFRVAGACQITFFTYSDATRGIYISKTDNVTTDEACYAKQPVATNKWTVDLDEAGIYYLTSYNDDFYFAGFEIAFPADPSTIFTFGYNASIEGSTISNTLTKYADDCAHVSTGDLSATYAVLGGDSRTVYHGSETAYQITNPYRNLVGSTTTIMTQNGETDGAENHGAYIAFPLTIAEGYKFSATEMLTDIYVDAKSNWYYEFIFEDNNGTILYKSPIQTIATAKSGSDHRHTTKLNSSDVKNLTGEIIVKLVWWISSSSTFLAIKDFNISGIVEDNSSVRTFTDFTVNFPNLI